MPKFFITKSVDAHVHSTAVEAGTADLTRQFARDHEGELTRHDVGKSEYNERDWANIEPEEVYDAFSVQIPGLGPEPRQPAYNRKPNPIECLRLKASGRRAP
jgi:hypothetical protein